MDGGNTSYANSGLARFGSIPSYQPPEYRPQLFQPAPLAERKSFQPGLLGNTAWPSGDAGTPGGDAPSTSASGGIGMGPGGSSALGNMGLSPTQGAAIGNTALGPVGAALGGLLGFASQSAAAADQTNPSSVNAVNGMDAMSDNGEAPGFATDGFAAADDGTTDGINGAIGDMGDQGDGGGGAGGK